MTVPLDPATRRRLVGALELLASPVAGEVSAAAAATTRLMRATGLGWDDIISPVAQHPRADPPRNRPPPTWRAEVAFAQRHAGWLRPWERDFVASVAAQSQLSRKQADVLREIATKLWARGAT